MDGLILIDKPRGPSSFDVVRHVRKVAGIRRVGHTGTLDPDASGVLAVAMGRCTKLAQFLSFDEKEYEFEVVFGVRTDSDDAMGRVIDEVSASHLDASAILNVLPDFVGVIDQVPPAFSAIHVDGKRAYELARDGIEFELDSRPVEIIRFELESFDTQSLVARMRVECGSGTYVRSLARDMAESLGTVAHARAIRRVVVGPFEIGRAVGMADLDHEALTNRLLSPAEMVGRLPRVSLEAERCHAIGMGQRVVVAKTDFQSPGKLDLNDAVAVLDQNGALVAVTIVEAQTQTERKLKPRRVLQPTNGPGAS
jgi:tRNA pseudouridine55 synthase